MSQDLLRSPNSEHISALVQLTVTRMTETADAELQAELVSAFEQVLAEFAAIATGPIERLLVQEIAICWTELQKLRATHARLEAILRLSRAAWFVAAISAAQARFFRSIQELSRVRRLAVPVGNGQ